ncbi:MAG: TauD/TfdA family dioxygenase [Hyphomicrobiaceae bacterium]|nr:TauD/TfdA family dioxygenase [Hyphomicrobiaceae bacterium]
MTSAADFPRFDASPANWKGPELAAKPERWLHLLTPAEIAELSAVVARHGNRTDDLSHLTLADVAMPALAPTLARIRRELLEGSGVMLIRGFDVAGLSTREAATAFWAIGLHLGEAVSQNAKGHALGHVRDLGFDYSQPSSRGYQTAERLPYHCDSGDVVGLLCLKTAKSGGLSSVVSSAALYHALVDRQPEAAATLMQSTWRDRRDEIPEGRDAWYEMPVFTPHAGRLFGHYVRSAIRKAQRFPEVPRITPEQERAFDALDALAASPELRLDMELQPGDIQLVCNHWVLHSRTKYEDWPEPERRRHLLRLWLGCPGGPDVPQYYAVAQGLTASGRPAGIRGPGAVLHAPLEAVDGGAGETAKRLKAEA